MLRDRAAAEDAVQQAFLELVKAAPELRGDGRSLRAWLYRSVRFTCLDELRRRSRRPEELTGMVPEPLEAPYDPHDLLLSPEVEAALDALTPEQRSVVLLRHVAGLSGGEVAEVLGSNRPAVYAMAARAEASLRRKLRPVESSVAAASEPVTDMGASGRTRL
jgi:RNA polymerase sigma-70 factor (ECF subfamily)